MKKIAGFHFFGSERILALVLILSVLSACSAAPEPLTPVSTENTPNVETFSPDTSVDVSVIPFRFGFTPQEFIDAYNSHYRKAEGQNYLRAVSEWICFEEFSSPFFGDECLYFRFNRDESVLTHPTISIYTPMDDNRVTAMTVDFDDHGYSDYLYQVYEEQCFYTIRTLLPEADDETVKKISAELNDLAYNNMMYEGLSPETIPDKLFCSENVGIFAYYGMGDYMRMCIIPVTEEYLDVISSKGTEVCFIEIQ